MPLPFIHKTAIITGAASGLGKALALELYRQGANLALIDIDLAGLQQLAATLQNDTQTTTIHQADIADEQQVIAARKQILEQHSQIDLLINNAGISISQPFEQMMQTDHRYLMEVNFWGMVYCTRHFLPDLHERPGSRIINIISNFALMGFPGKTAYASSKGAMMSFTQALKTELADTPVSCSLVIPPPLDTNIVASGKHINAAKQAHEARFLREQGMPLDKAARRIVAGIRQGKYRIVVGTMTYWTDVLCRLFPTLMPRLVSRSRKRFDFL